MAGKKATAKVKEDRLHYVKNLINIGKMKEDVINICAEAWGVSTRQSRMYFSVYEDIANKEFSNPEFINLIKSRMQGMYEQAVLNKDFALAVKIQTTLLDKYAASKSEVEHTIYIKTEDDEE